MDRITEWMEHGDNLIEKGIAYGLIGITLLYFAVAVVRWIF